MVKSAGQNRQHLTPDAEEAWRDFSKAVFTPGALDAKTKQLIAVAVAHVTQCPYCIRGHAPAAKRAGATEAELMEAIWVAAEMRAGGAVAHSHLGVCAVEARCARVDSAQFAGHDPIAPIRFRRATLVRRVGLR